MKKQIILLLSIFLVTAAIAEVPRTVPYSVVDPRGEPELVVCSQNLDNYGSFSDVSSRERESRGDFERKEDSLLSRFAAEQCDVIAVQEVLGQDQRGAEAALRHMGELLHRRTNRSYEAVVGKSTDKYLYAGFLVVKDRVSVLSSLSYANVELPKLMSEQKQRYFARGPLEIQLNVKGQGGASSRVITLITFHFKSKSSASGSDPAGLEFETWRMEMSEALRRIVDLRHKKALNIGEAALILLGDRNSNFDSASAKILEGSLRLSHFQGEQPVCRLGKRGTPICQAGVERPQELFSVLTGDPQTKLLPGTYFYKKTYSWLDDIIMPAESLPFAWANPTSTGDYDSGVLYDYKYASDHAMVWVKLNW